MRETEIVGWKTYGVAVIALIGGVVAFYYHYWADGVKGIVFGLALIALRDSIGKILRSNEGNRRTLSDLRAAIECELTSKQRNL
jgi:hypothetical protein